MNSRIECASCHHQIDAEARVCPFCGADPRTGTKVDSKPLLEKHFPQRAELTRSEKALDFFRQRQGIVVTAVIALLFLGLVGLHTFITARNRSGGNDVPAIPLTEVADLSNRPAEMEEIPIPAMDFQTTGSGKRLQTLMIEPGAVAPPVAPELTTENPTLNRFVQPKPPAKTRPVTPVVALPPGEAYTAPPSTKTSSPSTEPVPSFPIPIPTETEPEEEPERSPTSTAPGSSQ